jgi:hypothetical protein
MRIGFVVDADKRVVDADNRGGTDDIALQPQAR